MGAIYEAARIANGVGRASAASQQQRQAAAAQKQAEQAQRAAALAEAKAEADAADHLAERLDETVRAVRRYLWLTPAQADAIALEAAVSHVTDIDTLVSAARVMFVADKENVGKTTGMNVGVSLSYRPVNLAGDTIFGIRSAIFEAHTAGQPCPTFYRDEVHKVFGLSGADGLNNPVADLMLRGYRAYDAAGIKTTIGRSTNRSHDEASIFSICWMTGLRTAIPRDIRTRTIVINMQPAPEGAVEEFDLRDSVHEMCELRDALAQAVRGNREKIAAFRMRHVRGGPRGRRGEIWEGAFAVANAASQEWLNRAMAAYTELSTDGAESIRLSPEQTLCRDIASAARKLTDEGASYTWQKRSFVAGRDLRDELRRADSGRYGAQDDARLGRRMSEALRLDVQQSPQAAEDGRKLTVKGYFADDIEAAWQRMAPAAQRDVEVSTEEDIYA